jgi:hypothetical protein
MELAKIDFLYHIFQTGFISKALLDCFPQITPQTYYYSCAMVAVFSQVRVWGTERLIGNFKLTLGITQPGSRGMESFGNADD